MHLVPLWSFSVSSYQDYDLQSIFFQLSGLPRMWVLECGHMSHRQGGDPASKSSFHTASSSLRLHFCEKPALSVCRNYSPFFMFDCCLMIQPYWAESFCFLKRNIIVFLLLDPAENKLTPTLTTSCVTLFVRVYNLAHPLVI